ncbi:MAG: hypothetical protein IJ368_04890 [Oscillospiraceae bacterium]|nr:hypothetical protein [Oscillospiraceae bacterium]
MKNRNKIDMIWSVCLIIIGISTMIIVLGNERLPDMVLRFCGIIDLIAIPFLSYASIKKIKGR